MGLGICMVVVMFIDDLLFLVVCQDLSIDLDGLGMASVFLQDVDGGFIDNCGVVGLIFDII